MFWSTGNCYSHQLQKFDSRRFQSIFPQESKYNAQVFRKMEIEMLGMPLMGGPDAAKRGELVSIITGNQQAFEKTEHVIQKSQGRCFILETSTVLLMLLNWR